jgi:hypothetical protein
MFTFKCSGVAISLSILALVCDAAAAWGQTAAADEPSPETVAKLIARLGALDFRTRQQASYELEKLGSPVLPALRKAATANLELEVKRRIELVVIRINAASVEKLVNAYCARHGLARDKVESWNSAVVTAGRVFRYTLPAVQATEERAGLAERYALIFVDSAAVNIYDLKRVDGGDKTLDQRTWAILRLMCTKVTDNNHAEAMMADLWRIRDCLNTVHADDSVGFGVRVVQVTKKETARIYQGESGNGLHVTLTVDEDGYVTGFSIWSIR